MHREQRDFSGGVVSVLVRLAGDRRPADGDVPQIPVLVRGAAREGEDVGLLGVPEELKVKPADGAPANDADRELGREAGEALEGRRDLRLPGRFLDHPAQPVGLQRRRHPLLNPDQERHRDQLRRVVRLSRMPRQLVVLHDSLGTLLTVGAAGLGIWGTVTFWLRRGVGHRFRLWFLILTAVALLQVVLDVAFLAAGRGGGGGLVALVTAGVGFLVLAVPYVLASRWSREGEAATLCIVCWLGAMVFAGGLAA